MKKILYLLFMWVVLLNSALIAEEDSKFWKIVDEIIREQAIYLKNKHGMVLSATGGSSGGTEKVKKITVIFNVDKVVNVPESRELILESVEDFVERINASEDLKTGLCEYPFTVKSLEYNISFIDFKTYNRHPGVTFVNFYKGEIDYSESQGKWKPLNTICRETYEEALQRLKG